VLIKLVNHGSTVGAVNFPNVDLPYGGPGTHRVLNIHHNRPGNLCLFLLFKFINHHLPGVMRDVNSILSDYNVSGMLALSSCNESYSSSSFQVKFWEPRSLLGTSLLMWRVQLQLTSRSSSQLFLHPSGQEYCINV
jgi:hypothetical protein